MPTARTAGPAAVAGACALLAGASLAVAATPTYDAWTWAIWGREVASLDLSTVTGPAFKPLPVIVTTVLAPLGDAVPALWLVVARAGALLAVAMAFVVAARLAGSRTAGVLAAAAVVLCDGFVWHAALGDAEGLLLAFVFLAVERHLAGRPRQAFVLGAAAALLRTETWPFLALYGALLWRREPAARPLVGAVAVALPLAWFAPELWGSGDLLRSSQRARVPNPGAPALADRPALESLARAALIAPPVVAVVSLLAVRPRGGPAGVLAAAGLAWIGLVALMAEAGFSGEERYALPGAGLLCVAGAVAVAHLAAGRPAVVAAVVVALVPVAAVWSAALARDLGDVRRETALFGPRLDAAVDRAGGPAAVLACGRPSAGRFQRPALAWRLGVHLDDVARAPAAPGVAFEAAAGDWEVRASCA